MTQKKVDTSSSPRPPEDGLPLGGPGQAAPPEAPAPAAPVEGPEPAEATAPAEVLAPENGGGLPAPVRTGDRVAEATRMAQALAWYIPRDVEQALVLSRLLFKSGILPAAVKTPETALAILMFGMELGFKPMQAFRLVYIVHGRPAPTSDGLAAIVLASGKADYFRPASGLCSPEAVTWVTRRRGDQEVSYTFTMEDAEKAGLVKQNATYKAHPEIMLHHRCEGFLARLVYPDVVGGMLSAEEVEEVQAAEGGAESFDRLVVQINEAKTEAELKALATDIQGALLSNRLNPEQVEELRNRYDLRRRDLAPARGGA